MGEGVMEATIITWLFNEGDTVKEDDSVVEIATDKVDSDVPTPVSGKIIKILKQKDEIAKIGEVIAILEVAGEGESISEQPQEICGRSSDSNSSGKCSSRFRGSKRFRRSHEQFQISN